MKRGLRQSPVGNGLSGQREREFLFVSVLTEEPLFPLTFLQTPLGEATTTATMRMEQCRVGFYDKRAAELA